MLPQPFPTFRSVLLAEALVEHVLSLYDLGDGVSCTLYSRKINDIYFIRSLQGRWVLRITTANGQSPPDVQSEIDILRHLVAQGVQVVAPVARRDGMYVTVLQAAEGPRAAVLFEFVRASPVQPNPTEQARSFGQLLAQMHQAADTLSDVLHRPPHDYHFFIEEPFARLRHFVPFAGYTAELAYLQRAAASLWDQAHALPQVAPYFGLCHGDAKQDNALSGSNGAMKLSDFEYCGIGWRVYDLSTYIWAEIVSGPDLDWSKHRMFRALLEGYQSIRPLSAEEYAALPVFAALRQLFLFGGVVKYSPGYGMAVLSEEWFSSMVGFIRFCQDGQWLARVGLG